MARITTLFLCSILLVACGDDDDDTTGDASTDTGRGDTGGGADTGAGDTGPVTPGAGALGAACTTDGDCMSTFCLDLAAFDSSCTGKVCSLRCTSVGECTTTAAQTDPICETFGDVQACIYIEAQMMYCPS